MMKNLYYLLFFVFVISVIGCNKDSLNTVDVADDQVELRHDEIPGFNFGTASESANLTYFVNPNCFGTQYQTAITFAIDAYNDAPVGIGFSAVSTAAEADVVIDCVMGGGCGEAVAFFDDNENMQTSESNIDLYIDWEECLCTDPSEEGCNLVGFEPLCMFTRTVMHELGHVLGLHHNGEGIHIPGTPEVGNDPNSIFNSGPVTNANCDWCDAPCVFNDNDLIALDILYPCSARPKARIQGPSFLCELGQTVTYCIASHLDVVEWDLPSNLSEVSRTGNCITAVLTSFNGNEGIGVRIEDNGCEYYYSLMVNTHKVPNFDIQFNGPICLGDVVDFSITQLPAHQELEVLSWDIESEGLWEMSAGQILTAEGVSPGEATVCATVVNDCGIEKTYCIKVEVQTDSDCDRGDGLPNPK